MRRVTPRREVRVRCSSCEPLLDEYVDATLPPGQMHRVRTHLRSCTSCDALHRELRIVDGLLLTRRNVDIAPDFSQTVMARVQALPAPPRVRSLVLPLAAIYIVGAWIAVAVALLAVYREAPHAFVSAAVRAQHAFAAVAHAVQTLIPAPYALSFVVATLAVDVALLAALIYFYRTLRPRLAEHLAVARRSF
jgi:anti-sigma factor RsiW